ncbi:uncharacterized protein [Anabrus simplex]|uniref:uncharacterized protein n=1 Tax=Anabrus simplex TaxID=316456 RepID=UPI0035A27154
MSNQGKFMVSLTNEELMTILQPQFEKDLIVESYSVTYATQPGENYGSTMLALEVTICQTDKSPKETLHIVAKAAPPTEFLQEAFDIRNTFCKEMNIYKLVGPEIIKFQIESGFKNEDILDVLPKFYGARTTLTGDQDLHADTNAVLLLENLKTSGYKLADRRSGLDLKHCELVILKLAQFHALPIALKHKKPNVYKQTVLKATADYNMGGENGNPNDALNDLLDSLEKNIPEVAPYLTRIRENGVKYSEISNKSLNKEPFATIVHNDFWTNNMMFCYDSAGDNSQPISVKFVDFQVTLLCSPVKDIIFFLFSSGSTRVKKDFYEHLIQLYYETFTSTLTKMGCDVNVFSYEKFKEEVEEFAPTQFLHILFMIYVIYAEKQSAKNLSDVNDIDSIMQKPSDLCKVKILEHIQEFERRGWF